MYRHLKNGGRVRSLDDVAALCTCGVVAYGLMEAREQHGAGLSGAAIGWFWGGAAVAAADSNIMRACCMIGIFVQRSKRYQQQCTILYDNFV